MSSIIVLAGGNSDEREVSVRSGTAVAHALTQAGHRVQVIDPTDKLVNDKLQDCDVVFPVLHGKGREDGAIQQQLEDLGLTYVGSDIAASELCFDKWRYKQLLKAHNLPVPVGELLDKVAFWRSSLIKKPFVLKPNDGGSSIDNYLHRDDSDVNKSLATRLFSKHNQMLLEALISGTEITLSILGDEALPVIEIIPPEKGEFDYKNKYNGQSQELCPPRHVSDTIQKAAQALALKVHQLCGCRDFSRTDMMVTTDGKLQILETNTIPGMTGQSLFPKAAQTAGIAMPELVDRLVKFALARKTN